MILLRLGKSLLSARVNWLLLIRASLIDNTPIAEDLVCCLHRHATEIRYQMGTVRMASNITFRAFASILSSEREHVTTMTAPVRTNIGKRFEPMRNTVVDLLFVVFLKKMRMLVTIKL